MNLTEVVAEGLVRKYEGSITADEIGGRIDSKIEEIRPTMNLPGFRRGKVPAKLIRTRFGKQLRSEMVNDIIKEVVKNHLEATGDRPVTNPKLDLADGEETGSVKVTVDYECMPEIPEIDFSEITIERPVLKDTDRHVQRRLDKFLRQLVKPVSTGEDYEAAVNDLVVLDLKVFVEGAEQEDLRDEEHSCYVDGPDSDHFFASGLLGAKVGERRMVPKLVTGSPGSNDEKTEYECQIKSISKVEIPETKEERGKLCGGLDRWEALESSIRARQLAQYSEWTQEIVNRLLLDALDERIQTELPPSLLEEEANTVRAALLKEAIAKSAESSDDEAVENGSPEAAAEGAETDGPDTAGDEPVQDSGVDEEEVVKIASRRLKLALFMVDQAGKHELRTTRAEINRWIEQRFEDPEEQNKAKALVESNSNFAGSISNQIMERKVLRFIFELVTKTEVQLEFEEFLARRMALEELDDVSAS